MALPPVGTEGLHQIQPGSGRQAVQHLPDHHRNAASARLSRSKFAPAGLPSPAERRWTWQSTASFLDLLRLLAGSGGRVHELPLV